MEPIWRRISCSQARKLYRYGTDLRLVTLAGIANSFTFPPSVFKVLGSGLQNMEIGWNMLPFFSSSTSDALLMPPVQLRSVTEKQQEQCHRVGLATHRQFLQDVPILLPVRGQDREHWVDETVFYLTVSSAAAVAAQQRMTQRPFCMVVVGWFAWSVELRIHLFIMTIGPRRQHRGAQVRVEDLCASVAEDKLYTAVAVGAAKPHERLVGMYPNVRGGNQRIVGSCHPVVGRV